MKLIITGINTEVTEDIKICIEDKLLQFSEYIDPEKSVQVKIEEVKLDYRMEVMFSYNGMYIKADVKEKSIQRALNRAVAKIQKKIEKIEYKQSLQFSEELGRLSASQYLNEEEEETEKITRRKAFFIKPMTEEEAVMQMELLGHEFFMFFNGDIEAMCLLYKRKDGNYGLIESLN